MIRSSLFRLFVAALSLGLSMFPAQAHSGKARFHVIVDTDCAADDLRALCMLLGNREVEVLAVVSSDGALPPCEGARKIAALLRGFYHEGIPVGAGRPTCPVAPLWRERSQAVNWGDTTRVAADFPPAAELVAQVLGGEEERVVYVALGALTNLYDLLQRAPELGDRIERVVWYNTSCQPLAGANYDADCDAARRILDSGLAVDVVSAHPGCSVRIDQPLLDTLATIPGPYASRIVDTHSQPPLVASLGSRHMEAWDDLVVLSLFAPELFSWRTVCDNVRIGTLADEASAQQVPDQIMAVLRGKPDSESRVFYGFPCSASLYAADVVPIIDTAILRHGLSEWRAGVLTNELHGHLGIYATIGVKMGLRAREWFNIGVDDIRVVSYAGLLPPVSCLNDGLQVGTGATVGHGLIRVEACDDPRPEARFTFKDRTIRLTLKPEYARRIRDDVRLGIRRYGNLTEPYWQYVRDLALRYWRDFDRHEIFDLCVEP